MSWNNTYKLYNELVEELDHVPVSKADAMIQALKKETLPIGILYQTKKPVFHKELYGDLNPVDKSLSRIKRLEKIGKILNPK